MAVVCPQCGRRNPDGEQFCGNQECGAYLRWQPDGPAGGEPGRRPGDAPTVIGKATVPLPPAGRTGHTGTMPGGGPAAVVSLSEPARSVAPGETATTTVTVHNGGSRVESFSLSVLGPAAGWASVEPATLSVYPGEQAQATVRFAPPRHSSVPAGQAWFTVRASSGLHSGYAADAHGQLDVGQFRELTAAMHPQHTSGRLRTTTYLELANTGNVVETVRLQGRDQAGKLRFGLPASDLPMSPGRHRVRVALRAPVRLFGQRRSYPYHLTVTPAAPIPPTRLDGEREAVPLIAGWVPKLVAALVALGLCAGGAVWAATLLDRPPASPPPAPPATDATPPTTPPPTTPALQVVPPVLLTPPDGTVFDHFPRDTTLTWQPVPGAVGYVVEVDFCAPAGCEASASPHSRESVTDTSFRFNFVGAQPGRWRVAAVFPTGQSDFSEFRSFRYTQ